MPISEQPIVAPHWPSSGAVRGEIDVCLLSSRYHPTYGGGAERFRRYAPRLGERGVKISVVSLDHEHAGETRPEETPPRRDEVDGIPVYRYPTPSREGRRADLALARALSHYCRSVRRPDVLQLLSVPEIALPWLYQVRKRGTPVVITRTMVRDPSLPFYKLLPMLLAYRVADVVVVSSGVMGEALRREGYRGRIELIPNGVNLQRFKPATPEERSTLRRRFGFEEDAELVVFVGGFLNTRKGVDVLIEAWGGIARERPEAKLVLVGPQLNALTAEGPQKDFLARVQAALAESGAEDRVVFTGAIDHVEHYLKIADVFVFPSRREGMPNAVLEAFACGAPSVLTPFVGLPEEFGQPGKEYILVERTPGELAAAVTALLRDPDKRRSLSEAARAQMERSMNLERSLDRYAELYRELALSR